MKIYNKCVYLFEFNSVGFGFMAKTLLCEQISTVYSGGRNGNNIEKRNNSFSLIAAPSITNKKKTTYFVA